MYKLKLAAMTLAMLAALALPGLRLAQIPARLAHPSHSVATPQCDGQAGSGCGGG